MWCLEKQKLLRTKPIFLLVAGEALVNVPVLRQFHSLLSEEQPLRICMGPFRWPGVDLHIVAPAGADLCVVIVRTWHIRLTNLWGERR